jgi:phage gp16-like protein
MVQIPLTDITSPRAHSIQLTLYFQPVTLGIPVGRLWRISCSTTVQIETVIPGGNRMKKMMLAVICAVFVFGTIATGFAEQGDWHGGIRSRIQESKQKIEQGINQGTLDRHEADRLNAELGTILNKIDRMKADGYLSQEERDTIKSDLDRLDRDIFKEKHDGVSTAPAVQQDWRGGIRSRIQESKQKIIQGVERGTLNRQEARMLNKELGKILYKIDRMKADGRISQKERERINRDLDRLDRQIFKEKRNDDRRR